MTYGDPATVNIVPFAKTCTGRKMESAACACCKEGPPHTHLADDPCVVLCDEETPGTRAAHGGWSTQSSQACRPAVTGPPSDTGSSDQNNSAVGEHAPDDVVGDLAHVEPPKVVGHEGLPVRHSQRTHLAGIALQPS